MNDGRRAGRREARWSSPRAGASARGTLALAAALTVAFAAAGCQSTQDTSAQLAHRARGLLNVRGLEVTAINHNIKVTQTAVLHDANGTAAVVSLQNPTAQAQVGLPVSIAVRERSGAVAFRNNSAGIEDSLVRVSALAAHQSSFWVNDQVTGVSDPRSVEVRVGAAAQRTSSPLPQMVLSKVRLTTDPVNGPEAVGLISNQSKIAQRRLVIYCIAIKGSRVEAAGRAVVPLLAPAPTPKPVRFTIFFIGNPNGARLVFATPPTVLE